jgi:integrase
LFLTELDLVTVQVTVQILFLAFNVVTDLPLKYFKPARFVKPSPTAKDQRWYIEFFVFDAQKNKVVRKKYFKLIEGTSLAHKELLANQLCHEITQRLAEGKIIDRYQGVRERIAIQNNHNSRTGKIAVKAVIGELLDSWHFAKIRTKNTYVSITNRLDQFITEHQELITMDEFDVSKAKAYILYLKNEGLSPRSINNHLLTLRTIWNEAIKLQYTKSNPWKEIPRLKTPLGKNIAYLPHQQREILDFMKRYPAMDFLVKFMYYTLARTNEIAHLKVKHIGMYVPNKIYLEASISKNGAERHIIIPPGLDAEIEKRGIRKMDPEWFIFSKDKLNPGPVKSKTSGIGEKFRQWVLNKLKYPKEYTLYSWKHTGVIAAHKAGVSDDDIMKQTGHKDYGSFQKYLKSLGLFDNEDFANKIPKL